MSASAYSKAISDGSKMERSLFSHSGGGAKTANESSQLMVSDHWLVEGE